MTTYMQLFCTGACVSVFSFLFLFSFLSVFFSCSMDLRRLIQTNKERITCSMIKAAASSLRSGFVYSWARSCTRCSAISRRVLYTRSASNSIAYNSIIRRRLDSRSTASDVKRLSNGRWIEVNRNCNDGLSFSPAFGARILEIAPLHRSQSSQI